MAQFPVVRPILPTTTKPTTTAMKNIDTPKIVQPTPAGGRRAPISGAKPQ